MANRLAKVVMTLDGQRVEVGLDKIREKTRQLKDEMHKLAMDGKQNTKEYKDRQKAVEKLHKAEEDVVDVTKRINQYMKNLGDVATTDLRRAYREGIQLRDGFKGADAELQKLNKNLAKIKQQIDVNTDTVKKHQGAWGTLGTTMKNLFAYAGIFAGFNLLKAKLTEAYEANKRFSDSMANVRKVSGLTMDDIKQLGNNLSNIDSRTGLEGLMDLSYTGAKLGFGNYGIEGLESFTKSAVKVQNALSEDMGADAMTALSKMVEVMGLIPKMGVERAMDATGSAIFKLASTSTATGTNIVEFSKRLMGLANIAHISTADLLAFGSAADSMALMPEVAATAFNKLISAVQKQPNLIENALNIPKGTISDLYQAGHMTEALVTIFEKMREKGGMNALMQSGVFKDLGSDGARLVAVMATMANRVDMLNSHLQVSRQAFEEGTAVAQEYAIQMDTAAAYSERAANIWQKAFVNPEGVDTVREFTKAWYEVSKSLTSNKAAMAEIKFLLAGIVELMKLVITFLPSIIWGLTTMAGARIGMAIAGGLAPAAEAVRGLTLSVGALRVAWAALSTVAKANVIGAVATGIFAAIQVFGMFNKKVEEASGYMKDFKSGLSDLNTQYGRAEGELRRYRRAIDEANVGSKQRAAAIAQFNQKFKPYLSNLLTEKSTALDVAKAYNEITKAMRAKLALQLKEKDIESQVAPREQWTAERRQEYDRAAQKAGMGQYGSTWITGYAQDNRTKSVNDMVRNIGKQYYNLPQQVLDEVMKQVSAGARTFNNYGNIINSRYLDQANALLAAGSYFRQDRSAENAMRRVNKKWEPEQKAMDDMLAAQQQQDVIEPLQDAPDKGAIRAARKAAQEAKQAMRKEMQDAEQNVTGIISKLEEYYRLQEAAINEARASGDLTENQAAEMVRSLSILKNETLSTARRAVTTGDTTQWDKTKQQLQSYMADTSEVSQNLLHEIVDADVQALHTSLAKFNGTKDVYGLSVGAFFDQMNAKAAGNQREAARLRAKLQNEVEKALLQYQFVEQAQQKMQADLEKMGFITETYEQLAARLQAGITEKPDTVLPDGTRISDREAFRQMGAKFMQQGVINFRYNIDNEQEAQQWVHQFATNAKGELEGWAQAFPELSRWIDLIKRQEQGETLGEAEQKALEAAMPQIRNLYNEMLNHADRVNKAMKQAFEHEKQQQDIRFQVAGYRDAEERTDASLEMRGKMQDAMGTGQNFWQQNGLADAITTDPEVMRIQNRMQYRALEYQDAQRHLEQMLALQEQEMQARRNAGAEQEELDNLAIQHKQARAGIEQLAHDRETALLTEFTNLSSRVSQEIADRVQTIQSLSQPIADFAENAGQKLGDMIFNMESQSMTWNQIWKQMVLALAKSTIQMGAQWLTQKIQQALFYKQMEADETLHQTIMTTIALGGAMARMQGEAAINATSLGVNATTNAAEIGQEVSLATILTKLGISKGAAKIIGALGWWGIPLIAVISSLLMGLLASALSTAGSESAGATSSSGSASATKTKLVSGMLTYDKGNVDRFGGRRKLYDDGETQVYGRKHRYVGDDGRVYTATDEPSPRTGLVTRPIATTVQGQPALVAERGPEIVIGRETTQAIMMNEPELLQHLIDIDRNRSLAGNYGALAARAAFDEGTAPLNPPSRGTDGTATVADTSASGDTADRESRLAAALEQSNAALRENAAAMNALVLQLRQPVHINMYGETGLRQSLRKADRTMSRYDG